MNKIILSLLRGLRVLVILSVILGIVSSLFWIKSLISDSFTLRYVYFQIIVLLLVLGILWRIKGWYTHTNNAASILTILGVLGTFIGIYKGLQDFNPGPEVLQDSIEYLLDGLKTAFITSIIGIISALIIKGIISPIAQVSQKREDSDNTAINQLANRFANELMDRFESFENPWEINLSSKLDDLTEVVKVESSETRKVFSNMQTDLTEGQSTTHKRLETLTETVSEKQSELLNGVIPLLTTIQDSLTNEEIGVIAKLEVLTTTVSEKQDALLNGVKDALTPIQTSLADEQASVLTKLEALTTTVSDEHEKLRAEFETFSNNVAESITKLANKELVGALKTVIDEFNTNMVSQFGDNFRHLNEAVDRMVEWQKEYRQIIEKLTEEFHVAVESIEKSRESVDLIAESSEAIALRSESIVTSTEKLDPILHTLNGQLETFDNMSRNAQNAFPIIKGSLDELTTGFSETVKKAIEDSHASMEGQREALEDQFDHIQKTVEKNTDQLSEMTSDFLDVVEKSVSQAQGSMNKQREALKNQFTGLETFKNTVEQKLQEVLDGIKEQLNNVFDSSANQIAQLTTEFTQNLAQQLEKPVNDFTTSFSENINKAISDSQSSVERQHNAIQTQSDHLNDAVRNSVQSMQSQVTILQTGLEEALTTSLNGLVDQLTSLSHKFAEDYTPLTRKLENLLDLARDVEDERNRGGVR